MYRDGKVLTLQYADGYRLLPVGRDLLIFMESRSGVERPLSTGCGLFPKALDKISKKKGNNT